MDLDHAEFHRYIPPNREIYIEIMLKCESYNIRSIALIYDYDKDIIDILLQEMDNFNEKKYIENARITCTEARWRHNHLYNIEFVLSHKNDLCDKFKITSRLFLNNGKDNKIKYKNILLFYRNLINNLDYLIETFINHNIHGNLISGGKIFGKDHKYSFNIGIDITTNLKNQSTIIPSISYKEYTTGFTFSFGGQEDDNGVFITRLGNGIHCSRNTNYKIFNDYHEATDNLIYDIISFIDSNITKNKNIKSSNF